MDALKVHPFAELPDDDIAHLVAVLDCDEADDDE
jgi:hypothetical protein